MVDALERLVPFYYVHAGGLQLNYIDLKHDWNVFFKYEKEYKRRAHPKGTTIVFGVVYTLRIPKSPVASARACNAAFNRSLPLRLTSSGVLPTRLESTPGSFLRIGRNRRCCN